MPTIDYHAPIRVMAAVRGHPFDRNALAAAFDGMAGISVTFVDQPAAALLMTPDLADHFDAIALYDMPGIDFGCDAPGSSIGPDSALREALPALLDRGIGVVALHHALSGWPAWPDYAELLGGRFLYRPDTVRGVAKPDSGYRHNVAYTVEVLAPDHPVVAGLPRSFPLTDELYLAEVFEDCVIPLLRSDYAFVRDNFHSATEAMNGRMFSNAGWSHEDGSALIGWVKKARKSPLVYLQAGDNEGTYGNPHYHRLLENALRWVVSPEAKAWAKA